MKKIIAQNVFSDQLETTSGPFARTQVMVLYGITHDDMLATHRQERADIIVADFSQVGDVTTSIRRFVKRVNATRRAAVIATCEGSESSVEKCRKAGATVCMGIPVSPSALTESVLALLDIPTRRSFRVFIQVSVKGETARSVFFAAAENISATGILVISDRKLSVGDRLACSFFMRSNEITVMGEVRRTEPASADTFRYGIQFVDPDAATAARIEDYVRGRHIN